jgi:hypothetical protein
VAFWARAVPSAARKGIATSTPTNRLTAQFITKSLTRSPLRRARIALMVRSVR